MKTKDKELLKAYTHGYKDGINAKPQGDNKMMEIIYLDDDIHSMDYKQYNKDGEIIKAGNILYPEANKDDPKEQNNDTK